MESGPSDARRPMSRSRVGSARAANTGTASFTFSAAALRLGMLREVLRLPFPPLLVHPERLGAAAERDAVEARLDDGDGGAVLHFLEGELDEGHRFLAVIGAHVDRVGVPLVEIGRASC